MLLVASVKSDPISLIAQVHVEDQCGSRCVVVFLFLLVLPATGVLDAVLVGDAGFAHAWLGEGLLAAAQELVFLLLLLTAFVHSV